MVLKFLTENWLDIGLLSWRYISIFRVSFIRKLVEINQEVVEETVKEGGYQELIG